MDVQDRNRNLQNRHAEVFPLNRDVRYPDAEVLNSAGAVQKVDREIQHVDVEITDLAVDVPDPDAEVRSKPLNARVEVLFPRGLPFYFPQVRNITTAAVAIAAVASQPKTFISHGMVNLPITFRLDPISIITTISGTAATPLI
ncbi:MAG TPA: hypothetical protein VIM06_01280, partial [Rhodanobacter sp.]